MAEAAENNVTPISADSKLTDEQKRDQLRARIEAGEKRNEERNLGDQAKEVADSAIEFTKKHPLAVVGGVLVAGIAIGAMTRRGRRLGRRGGAFATLAADACRAALGSAGLSAQDIDLIVLATATPDQTFPASATKVQAMLGIDDCVAFDVAAVCSGFLYALQVADAMLRSGAAKRALVIGAETFCRILDWEDRGTCVLFGDGAAAAILGETDREDAGVITSNWGADGTLAEILYQPAGGTQRPATAETVAARQHVVHMEGSSVFRQAVRAMTQSSMQALEGAGMTGEEIDLMIPHQANIRIIEATRARVGVPEERAFSNVHRYGNVSAATIPIALHEARAAGRVARGDRLLLTSFGTGLTWASSVLRW